MRRTIPLLFTAALLVAGVAGADPIGPDDCTNSSCQGGIYTLEYDGSPIATDAIAHTETYRVTFTIESAGINITDVFGVDTVAVKIAPSIVDGSIVSAPISALNWEDFENEGLNADGCANGGGGFLCATVVGGGTVPAVGGDLVWVFDIEIPEGTLLDGLFEASVKARFVDIDGNKVGALLSEPITLQVPEPASMALLCMGLLGLAGMGRRRNA